MSLFVNDVSDYIIPSQECINPFVLAREEPPSGSNESTKRSKISLVVDDSQWNDVSSKSSKPDLILKSKGSSMSENKTVAKVSLNDCLACR